MNLPSGSSKNPLPGPDSLSENERLLASALDHMTHGLCMFDAEGRIVLFNRCYAVMMGQSVESLRGLSLLELFKRRKASGAFLGDPDQFFHGILASMREGKTTTREMVRSDGVTLRVIDRPMEGGGWVATYEDVTEHRRAEHDRDRNRAFLDMIIDNVPSVIFVKNAADRKYVLVNQSGERFWGVPRATMIGKTADQIFAESEAKKIAARDDELAQSGQALFDERELLTPCSGVRSIFVRRLIIGKPGEEAQYLLGVVDDVTERKVSEARIARLAHYDALTDLPNRAYFYEQLEKKIVSLAANGGRLAVLYVDLDHFKSINDTLGHPAGDALLQEVAVRLRSCIGETDLVARLGGDEFAVVLTALKDRSDAEALARRLRAAVTERPYSLLGHQTTTDISIGIAVAPEDGTELDEVLKHADLALYAAKTEGRATSRSFEAAMTMRVSERRQLEVDLRTAVVNAELELHYQPVVNLASGAITGCEALLRWNHPRRGLVRPDAFIPLAEETGLITPIGEWVLQQACIEARRWPDHVTIAVNVSPVQFRNPGLALTIAAVLGATGLPAHRLELEVTETALMQNNESTLNALHQIRALGARISLDDFGTGYSSLSYLRSFPFDKIKIDRSFVSDLAKGEDAVAIVKAILSLAKSLKMATTAEGVETAHQLLVLQAAGCDEMQGYLFSPPLDAARLGRLLQASREPPQRLSA
jgi:diguanylate cyclase (GGDEF)-like protein/PAS domain S-box-containing protein